MDKFTLVIGNKNYSSWSLRPWLLLTHFEIPFEEIRIPLYQEKSKAQINKYSPSGLVPVLINGDFKVWDSLAICEYVQDLFPEINMWPRDREARAIARAVSAEMHSGFTAVRTHMPMNCKKSFPGKGLNQDSEPQIKRITQIWRDCRNNYGKGGSMLFGEFSIADAMFAPVAIRFNAYKVGLDETSQAYVSAILALPAMKKWVAAACLETEVMSQFEAYEKNNG
jgi:glutathione S-transferase